MPTTETLENTINGIINGTNNLIIDENSNKNSSTINVQRDLIAGEVSKLIGLHKWVPADVIDAHNQGIIHIHDADYFLSPGQINCCLPNFRDMLLNGTVINGVAIESPKSFHTACTILTQIIAAISGNQYGGQSVNDFPDVLAPFVRRSWKKHYTFLKTLPGKHDETDCEELAWKLTKKEIRDGLQTIQYQINTLVSGNGQSPFLTLFLHFDTDGEYAVEAAMIVEELLRQRIKGVKNEKGVYITPTFPKLVYVLDDSNVSPSSPYSYLTMLAAECTMKRMYPDYISAPLMRENYEGNVFSPMGCVDGDEVISYKFNGSIYVESFIRAWRRLSSYFEVKNQIEEDDRYQYMDVNNVEVWDTQENSYTPMHRMIRNRAEDWLRITFTNGRVLTVTPDHPFETENRGIVYAKDLKETDIILINNQAQSCEEGTVPYNSDKAWLLGVILCDGSYCDRTVISIAAEHEDDIEHMFSQRMKTYYELDTKTIIQKRGRKGTYKDVTTVSDGKGTMALLSAELAGFFGGRKKAHRHIPPEVFRWDKAARLSFLAGMIDADGYINTHNSSARSIVQIGSTNKELALQQALLAQSCGMSASIFLNHYRANNKDCVRYRVEFDLTQDLADQIVCEKKRNNCTGIERKSKSLKNTNFAHISSMEPLSFLDYSYDVTTESEHFEVSGVYSHNCRSFLPPYKNKSKDYQFEGRFNKGVCTINLPNIGLTVGKGNVEEFFALLDERLEHYVKPALIARHNFVSAGTTSSSPIHWCYGGLARLPLGVPIPQEYLRGYYSTLSIGYIGIEEACQAVLGQSHTTPRGTEFALRIMRHLNTMKDRWNSENFLGFSIYGTPAESLTAKACLKDTETFGVIPHVTDKGFYTNSYHVHVEEPITVFDKFDYENQFQSLSQGGCISYAELGDMGTNIEAMLALLRYGYEHIQYFEFNLRGLDYCSECGFSGESHYDEGRNVWECPMCGNDSKESLYVVRRSCGYLGSNRWLSGRAKEINARVTHI